jgi:hypothetical protein
MLNACILIFIMELVRYFDLFCYLAIIFIRDFRIICLENLYAIYLLLIMALFLLLSFILNDHLLIVVIIIHMKIILLSCLLYLILLIIYEVVLEIMVFFITISGTSTYEY